MKLVSLDVLEVISPETSVLQVKFDDGSEAIMFHDFSQIAPFLDKEVIVDFRNEFYKGHIVSVVNTLTEVAHVHVFDKEKDFKLFTDETDNYSNVVFKDIQDGTTIQNATMLCVSQSYESSARASWHELVIRDKMYKLSKLRLFDYDNSQADFTGRYIKCALRKNKYGYTTQDIYFDETIPAAIPDTALAVGYIQNVLQDREDIKRMFDDRGFYKCIIEYIDKFAGAEAITLAYELKLLTAYQDMLPDILFDALMLAVIIPHLHVTVPVNIYSSELRGIIIVTNYELKYRKEATLICDENSNCPELVREKALYKSIRETAAKLLEVRYES